jgi:hypothetical protein
MSKISSAKVTDKQGAIITRYLEENIIETVYQGHISLDGTLNRDLEVLLKQHPGVDWLVDASGAAGIDAGRRDNAGNAIDLFRRLGGGAIAAVIPNGPIRMVASALSFGFDLRLKIFPNRADALAHLRAQR